jgi:hypothetical protein
MGASHRFRAPWRAAMRTLPCFTPTPVPGLDGVLRVIPPSPEPDQSP